MPKFSEESSQVHVSMHVQMTAASLSRGAEAGGVMECRRNTMSMGNVMVILTQSISIVVNGSL